MPDLIELLGCQSVLASSGEASREVSWQEVRAAKADLIVAACCGFDEARALQDAVPDDLDVAVLNGYEYFSRPSPRLTDSLAMLDELLVGRC